MRVQGREGQWAWRLHRLTGLGVLAFLCLHVVDTAMLLRGEAAYNHLLRTVYQQWWFQPMEIALGAALLFHALNGVRLILVDFWEDGIRYERPIRQALLAVFVVSTLALAVVMLWPFVVPATSAAAGTRG
jgi:succinate dehydrogenase / fumarate reductase cytochrome b subunit